MRYCLVVIIFILAGMYFLALGDPNVTWLPAPTAEESQEYNQRGLRNLAARADANRRLNNVAQASAARLHREGTDESRAYTSCDTPVADNAPDFDSDF